MNKTTYYRIPANLDNCECYIICKDTPDYVDAAYVNDKYTDENGKSKGWYYMDHGWKLELFGNYENKQELTKEEYENAMFLNAI